MISFSIPRTFSAPMHHESLTSLSLASSLLPVLSLPSLHLLFFVTIS